jgi:hypothetical protein
MSALQRRITAVTGTTVHLVAQLRELDELRDKVKKAMLTAKRARQKRRRSNGKGNFQSTGREPAGSRSERSDSGAVA